MLIAKKADIKIHSNNGVYSPSDVRCTARCTGWGGGEGAS